jgi:hypothetical protein
MLRLPSVGRQFAWFLAGFAASSALGLVIQAASAQAQTTFKTQINPAPIRGPAPPRRAQAPAQPSDDLDLDQPSRRSAIIVRKGSDAEAADIDQDDPARQATASNADGLPADGMEQLAAQDGVIPAGEADSIARDGEAAIGGDARSKQDIDAFESPPAGYDALAFQIEVPGPILDRRPVRLARFEPYDPIGIRKGSWVILPEIEFAVGATSNLFRSPQRVSASFFETTPQVRAVTNWRVHAIELKARGLASAFADNASENDRAHALEARGRYDLGRRSNVEVFAGRERTQDVRASRDFNEAAARRPNIDTSTMAAAFNHRFNRLTVQLRGSYTDVDVSNAPSLSGTLIDNTPRDVVIRETAGRATWEFKPNLFAFTELGLNDRRYRVTPVDGVSRDSHGHRLLAGVGFGNTGTVVRGEIAAGYGRQAHEDARLGADLQGLLVEANLGWRPTALTSFLLTARTDLNDSTTIGQTGSLSRNFGLEARQAFRRNLIGIAGLRRTVTSYRGVDLSETETSGDLGVEYHLDRSAMLFARYTHTAFDSSAANADFNVDAVRVGLRLRQ